MPKLSKNLPPVPPVTADEEIAQNYLHRIRELLWFVEWFLDHVQDRLPYPQDAVAEDMGSGVIPESLTFSLRGAVECAMHDHVEPLNNLLRKAAKETPARLVRDWQKRQGKGKR
jgi:hypothetical protein